MKKINIICDDPTRVALHVFDWYYAYYQHKGKNNGYQADLDITYENRIIDGYINIKILSVYHEVLDVKGYDLVLLDNAGEWMGRTTADTKNFLDNHDNVYFLCGTFLPEDHAYYKKVIPYNHCYALFFNTNFCGFYPQYYDRINSKNDKRAGICFINGNNKLNRNYIMNLINDNIPSITIKSSWQGSTIIEKNCFDSEEDMYFRNFLNQKYNYQLTKQKHYVIAVGPNKKFGDIAAGLFVLDEYYDYECIVFPESDWANDCLFMTEKIFKCFISECIPFPIGGSGINLNYNLFGFKTAWNLLPDYLKEFDNEKNHVKRMDMIINALDWLNQNQKVFHSQQAEEIKQSNKINFINNRINLTTVEHLDNILSKY